MRYLFVLSVFSAMALSAPAIAQDTTLTAFPMTIERACRGGSANIYDECGDQHALFKAALAEANRRGKVLLVSYGAEWCIWCHVFHDYVKGVSGSFTHTFSDPADVTRDTATMFETPTGQAEAEATALASYAAESFVLVHLEMRHARGADEAVASTGFDPNDVQWLPFVFTVSPEGEFGASLDHDTVESRREYLFWFRGYQREALMRELERMRNAALLK
ncbi:MAG: hypothetical protein AAFR73_07895 [Pseudomonadota bacterium]